MAPHSSALTWKIPWTEEPGGLQSMGTLRVGHNWATEYAHRDLTTRRLNGVPMQTYLTLKRELLTTGFTSLVLNSLPLLIQPKGRASTWLYWFKSSNQLLLPSSWPTSLSCPGSVGFMGPDTGSLALLLRFPPKSQPLCQQYRHLLEICPDLYLWWEGLWPGGYQVCIEP